VQNRRLKLGIPPAANPKCRPWTEAELSLLGTEPDSDVARRIGRPYVAVRDKRNQLNIPYQNPRYDWWKPDELALLSTLPEEEVARRTNRSVKAVRLKLWKLQSRRASA
jgi:hypothetical protein